MRCVPRRGKLPRRATSPKPKTSFRADRLPGLRIFTPDLPRPVRSTAGSPPGPGARYAALLRQELAARNGVFAAGHGLPHAEGTGGVVAYLPYVNAAGQPAHGNFFPAAYRAIHGRPDWARRTAKVHTSGRSALPRTFNHAGDVHAWREMDSAMSSDALLMSVFCTPAVARSARVAGLLGVAVGTLPAFGVPGQALLRNGGVDRTELDMRIGDVIVEAKLTEADFQSCPLQRLEAYRDFAELFDAGALAMALTPAGAVRGYQLVRNILAAHARGVRFCLIADVRRPDLLEQYVTVQRALVNYEMRTRCTVLTWQEIAAVCPSSLRAWLEEKYGIAGQR